MLANGAKLYYSLTDIESSALSGWTELKDLKELPDLGQDPERVENTGLNDANKQYEMGVGDLGETIYTFKWPSKKEDYATSAYVLGKSWQAENKTVYFKEVLKDGFITKFSAQVSVKRTGGALNSPLACQMNMAINSDLETTAPANS